MNRRDVLLIVSAMIAMLGPMLYFLQMRTQPVPHTEVRSPFEYSFAAAGTLQEAGSMEESASPYWWLNSGAELQIRNGIATTVRGDLSLFDRWRYSYRTANARDSDGGVHPQNLFRLVTRSKWRNVAEEMQVRILDDHLSDSPNRNESNGLLLMSRYAIDGQTLYYAGIRVDGHAVIKKKYHGTYYTIAESQIIPGDYSTTGRDGSQNLLPHNMDLGVRTTTVNNDDGSVTVTLYLRAGDKQWQKVLFATDSGDETVGNTPPLTDEGYLGIRTDFMDVAFTHFRAEVLP